MEAQTAVVLGATGLIGKCLIKELVNDSTFSTIKILVWKPLPVSHPKLVVQIVDFNNLEEVTIKMGNGDCIFCSVGTTQQKVKGNKDAYRKVDYDIQMDAARIGIAAGFKKFLLVSAVGANATSGNFYLRLKGEVEKEISTIPFESIHIFQPSVLLGKRNEFRAGELISKGLMQTFSFFLFGSLRKYRPVQAQQVASAMITASKKEVKGVQIYQFDEMQALAK